jgi:hypothetical protein
MFSTSEMCRLAGCSYRQLDYWMRHGVIHPAIRADVSGTRRAFSPRQVPIVRMVADLSGLGATCDVMTMAAFSADLIPADMWHGIAYVTPTGAVDFTPPGSSCWAVDLGKCSKGVPQSVRQMTLA